MTVITWIGLGNMGLPMALRQVDAGHKVRGVDIDPAIAAAATSAGLTMFDTAAAALDGSDAVITSLPTGSHVRDLLAGPSGLFSLAPASTLFVDTSTIDIDTAKELHVVANAAGVRFLDAPVSGGVVKAAAGTLTFMIGGTADNVAAATELVQPMSGKTVHAGGAGAGQAAKIVNNMILGVCLAATCEGSLLSERLGLDAHVFYDIAMSSSAENFALREWYPVPGVVPTAPSTHGYRPGFTSALLLKDMTLALQASESTNTPVDTARAAHTLYAQLVESGAGSSDCSALFAALADRSPTAAGA